MQQRFFVPKGVPTLNSIRNVALQLWSASAALRQRAGAKRYVVHGLLTGKTLAWGNWRQYQ
jgi:hypothetical protein